MTERETRTHLLEKARIHGVEAPLLTIFARIDEALKHAKSKVERDLIALEGIAEIDKFCGAVNSRLNDVSLTNVGQDAIDKFNKR